MRVASRPSWRLTIGDDPLLSAALWIRDAAGILVEADDVPPPLVVRPPASHVLDGEDLAIVGRDWLAWWRALLAMKLDERRAPPPGGTRKDLHQWASANLARRGAAGGPDDDFAALAHARALRRACQELFRDAHRARAKPRLESTPWEVYKRLVDEVAVTHGVDRSVLDGTVLVVPSCGGWWRVLEPGFVLASDDAPADDVLRASLESPLQA